MFKQGVQFDRRHATARIISMDQQSTVIARNRELGITLLTFLVLLGLGNSMATAQQSRPAQSTTRSAQQTSAEPRLHQAARTGDLATLTLQLNSGISANLRDSSGRTALMEAAEAGQIDAAHLLIQHGADVNAAARTGNALETAERTGHMDVAALLRHSGARTSGHSIDDTVCVRPWRGDGYCGIVESIDRNDYQLRVTEIVGCKDGCAARAECSAERAIGGADGIKVGDKVHTKSWCLTHTGVQR